ncbi:DNA translocase FtsK [Pandoraea sp. B-6]|uniref:DNA translocase FtsK n=1 Tax=Pandoraea sp. B-6 TaxID=1204340 RepID=UPI0018DED5FD|nr:DNA translocase FtsK [Pandoraea sp. B-6]
MGNDAHKRLSELGEKAKSILIEEQEVSVSLLQRRFRMGYSDALRLMSELEEHHVVTAPGKTGVRTFQPPYQNEKAGMINRNFSEEALAKFVGCDSDELAAGTPSAPSIWLFGIEHGTYKSQHDGADPTSGSDEYSIGLQRKWPYNQKAFKLLAAMKGFSVANWSEFAETHQPFVRGSRGYFKGNLYPFACHDVGHWPQDAADETGIADKREYQAWCRDHRLPAIRSWVEEYQPEVFIGVGIGYRADFASAVFDDLVTLNESVISARNQTRRVFHQSAGRKKLVVVPHFSSPSGLNSDALLQRTGEFIADLVR